MPSPKAPGQHMVCWRSTLTDIDTSLFYMAKEGHTPISNIRKAELNEQIIDAIGFYIDQVNLPKRQTIDGTNKIDPRCIVTITEQKKELQHLVARAKKLYQNIEEKPKKFMRLLRNLERSYRLLDQNTKVILKKTLKILDIDFFTMIANLHFKHLKEVPDETYETLQKLINFTIPQINQSNRYANPALVHLILILVPIWEEATGRTCMRTNASADKNSLHDTKSTDMKRYLFAEAIIFILEKANAKIIPKLDQIDKICKKIKKPNLVPHAISKSIV